MPQRDPLGRGGTPEEAAGSVYLFCMPESNYITGQTWWWAAAAMTAPGVA